MFELSELKQQLLRTSGNLLVMGGPGSGKTTIALLKAKKVIEEDGLKNEQKVLFLSFARATIAQIMQGAAPIIPHLLWNHLEINTYHGFAWNIIKAHGYLINSNFKRLLPPPEAASRLAGITGEEARNEEKHRLFEEEGLLHFDLFAKICAELLSRSDSLSAIISDTYPVIILDEFQDTNADEWSLIRILGKRSRLIALADPEQRIYEFRGADPARIREFIAEYNPTLFDFGNENHRSRDTDIVEFGNDLLTGENKRKKYKNVCCIYYPYRRRIGRHFVLKKAILDSINRLKGKEDWSLAILVPSNIFMLDVSKYLDERQEFVNAVLPRINHDVALDTEGPALAAVLIARLLEFGSTKQENVNQMIFDLCEHIRGRMGDNSPSKINLLFAEGLMKYLSSGNIGRSQERQLAVDECKRIAKECKEIEFTGDPSEDWLKIMALLGGSSSKYIIQVESDAKYLRLLHKGSTLRSNLGNLWRNNGSYSGAVDVVKNALLQEHFSLSLRVQKGIHVMTIHKAKGKEFDEVIIYEGLYKGRIVYDVNDKKKVDQARLNLRVAVTRARSRTTILTPANNVCCLL